MFIYFIQNMHCIVVANWGLKSKRVWDSFFSKVYI